METPSQGSQSPGGDSNRSSPVQTSEGLPQVSVSLERCTSIALISYHTSEGINYSNYKISQQKAFLPVDVSTVVTLTQVLVHYIPQLRYPPLRIFLTIF
jgi:hypothetical protein